jgi:serine/threonine protein kinase
VNRFSPAPSHNDEKGYSVDVFSVAIILFELFNGGIPFVGPTGSSIADTLVHDARFNLHDYLLRLSKTVNMASKTAECNLVASMLSFIPTSRPTLAQAYTSLINTLLPLLTQSSPSPLTASAPPTTGAAVASAMPPTSPTPLTSSTPPSGYVAPSAYAAVTPPPVGGVPAPLFRPTSYAPVAASPHLPPAPPPTGGHNSYGTYGATPAAPNTGGQYGAPPQLYGAFGQPMPETEAMQWWNTPTAHDTVRGIYRELSEVLKYPVIGMKKTSSFHMTFTISLTSSPSSLKTTGTNTALFSSAPMTLQFASPNATDANNMVFNVEVETPAAFPRSRAFVNLPVLNDRYQWKIGEPKASLAEIDPVAYGRLIVEHLGDGHIAGVIAHVTQNGDKGKVSTWHKRPSGAPWLAAVQQW